MIRDGSGRNSPASCPSFGRTTFSLKTSQDPGTREWQIISAAAEGAPHTRERVWIVAYSRCERRQQVAEGAHGGESAHEGRAPLRADKPASDGEGHRAGILPTPMANDAESGSAVHRKPDGTGCCNIRQPMLKHRGSPGINVYSPLPAGNRPVVGGKEREIPRLRGDLIRSVCFWPLLLANSETILPFQGQESKKPPNGPHAEFSKATGAECSAIRGAGRGDRRHF